MGSETQQLFGNEIEQVLLLGLLTVVLQSRQNIRVFYQFVQLVHFPTQARQLVDVRDAVQLSEL